MKIYIVIQDTGDDYHENKSILGVFTDQAKAQEFSNYHDAYDVEEFTIDEFAIGTYKRDHKREEWERKNVRRRRTTQVRWDRRAHRRWKYKPLKY